MEIIRAEHSGFCFGVDRAIDMAFKEAATHGREGQLYSCGHLIHNSAVVRELEKRGVGLIDSLSEAKEGDTVIVRSHGEPLEFYEEAEQRGIRLVDTTCVFVEKIHKLVHEAHNNGRSVVVVGSREHQEVKATNGWCGYEALILENAEEAKEQLRNAELNDPLVVCQTTIKVELLNEILEVFDSYGIEYEIKNTICNATRDRQKSCADLSKKVDLMIVIGDRHSSNSKKLHEITKENCKNCIFIENSSNLQLKDITPYNTIGIIAGASTPEWIIKEVISSMKDVTKNIEQNPMMDFMDDIEKSLRLPKPGDIIDGKVDQVMDDAVIVNMGCKKDGILRADEVVLEEGQKLSDIFKAGDDIQAKVIKSDEGEGGILLSKKRLVAVENYAELEQAMENKEAISVKIIRAVNGGVIAAYKEITGFMPMSQLDDKYVESADQFIGQTVDVRVIRVDTKRNRAVFSRKTILREEKDKAVSEIWNNLNVGDVVEGKVMRFTPYGAFVDIGGVDGLLHISEISWGKIKHPEEVLNIGDIINVKILTLNQEISKISLGLKQTQPEPWSLVGDKYNVGDVVEGKIVQIKEYGAFVELEAGLDGLVHISEIANKRVENVFDELKVGEPVQVKIMEIDPEKKRISLSIKATLPEEVTEDVVEAEEAEAVEE
ncbi:MAG: bifunctional 4-hydroxy-3-methylbut-2-enyl diphosphate reductase/30S ribosomal protein S1 [Clostridiales bacterium]|nr:bifunctional 4-hydroxy-3-methylbut-2-enyl diphosphate reductase/30S ribosomal protein S1 [Candidatus Crickella caballi]